MEEKTKKVIKVQVNSMLVGAAACLSAVIIDNAEVNVTQGDSLK